MTLSYIMIGDFIIIAHFYNDSNNYKIRHLLNVCKQVLSVQQLSTFGE